VKENISDFIKKISQLIENGDFDQALSYVDQVMITDSNNPDLLNKKGIILRALGRYDEALECFNKSLHLDPRDLDAS
jgi:Flp pilus assembly protein TadD